MQLTLAEFVFTVVLGSFVTIPVLAAISRTLHHRTERRALADRVICRLCLHAFEERSRDRVVRCPACGAANEKGRSRRLG
jgi:hypothetical protein